MGNTSTSSGTSSTEMEHPLLKYLAEQNKNSNGEYTEQPDVVEHMIATLNVLITLPNLQITEVRTVHNNFVLGMYELKKMEYRSRYGDVEEKILIHSTAACNVDSIIKNNLNWRLVTRHKYGKGVSFSDDADYANFHANRSTYVQGSKRAFIVAKVLVSRKTVGNCYMEIPPNNVDTSYSSNNKVYVKFSDNEFLVKYIVFYNAPDITKSKHYRFRRR